MNMREENSKTIRQDENTETDDMNTIGENIKTIRQEKKISQEELAAMVFTTRQTISNYETGKSAPDLDMIAALARALEVDSGLLLYGDRKEEKKRHAWALWIGALILLFLVLIFTKVFQGLVYVGDGYKQTLVRFFWETVMLCPVLYLLGWSTAGVILQYVPPERRLFRKNRRIMLGTVLITGIFAAAALLTVLTATGTMHKWPTYGVLGRLVFNLVNVIAVHFWPKLLFVLFGVIGCVSARGTDA